MKKIFITKPVINKKNNQISICIPRRKIRMFKDKIPIKIKFKIEDIEWQ